MKKIGILDEAKEVVGKRQVAYDKPEDNFQRIADLWNAYIQIKGKNPVLEEEDVAAMMILLKVARLVWHYHRDGAVDIAGYAHCWNNIAEKKSLLKNSS